jgi:hypothetical protein
MANGTEWARVDNYHLQGMDGGIKTAFTIAKVRVSGVPSYELWRRDGVNKGTMLFSAASVDEVKEYYHSSVKYLQK